MAIAYKHQGDLESMSAGFTSISKISSDPKKEKKVKDKKVEKTTD